MVILLLLSSVLGCELINYTDGGTDWKGTCATGSSQSPVDLVSETEVSHYIFPMASSETGPKIEDCISYYHVEFESSFYAKNPLGKTEGFKGDYISFHVPSEHKIKKSDADLEVQFHYKNVTSAYRAAISILYNSGGRQDDPFLTQFIQSNDTLVSSITALNLTAELGSTLALSDYYLYEGSLTTPPCTEKVLWYVIATTKEAPKAQIDVFKKKWPKGNKRDLQLLNSRQIYHKSSK